MHKAAIGLLAAVSVAAAGLVIWAERNGADDAGIFRVVAEFPHDSNAFTQGLVVHDGLLLESTGHYGASSLRSVEIESGRVVRLVPLGEAYFAEGIAVLGDRIYQLTWQNGLGFVYDAATLRPLGTFRYAGEGWGLTTDGTSLILSDGTAELRFLDPETYAVERRMVVRDGDAPLARLNELEWVDGEIWANVWYDDRVARIEPTTGEVRGWLDLGALYPAAERPSEAVLNGIAYDAESGRLFVTGKNWPRLFEIAVTGR